jgi:hypothetical protein
MKKRLEFGVNKYDQASGRVDQIYTAKCKGRGVKK